MHRLHGGLTIAATIKKGEANNLREILKSLNKPDASIFSKSNTTLFVSGLIMPEQVYNRSETLPETLLFSTTYWGPLATHLNDLITVCKKDVLNIFRRCDDFPPGDLVSDAYLLAWLKAHSRRSAFHSRYDCMTKDGIEREKKLRNEIEDYLDAAQKLHAFDHLSAIEIRSLIQRHIVTRGDKYEWAHKPEHRSLIENAYINRGPIAAFVLLSALLAYIKQHPRNWLRVTGAVAAAYILLRTIAYYITKETNPTAVRPDDAYVQSIASTQLRPILNEMNAIAPLKKGRLRRFFYAASLRVANFFSPFLMNIPTVSSIRWLVVNDRKRLVFLSNYTNTTDFYVRDFLNGNTPNGVNFMFGNGEGFPDAKYLFKGGIREDPEGYMNAVHTGQQVTDLWYPHDLNITADIINKNREIRNGLFKKMDEEEAAKWLQLL